MDKIKMRQVFNFMAGKPGRITGIGSLVGHVGWFFSLAGLFGRFPGMVGAALDGTNEVKNLSSLYPSLPLWWVPESAPSMLLAILVCIGGASLWSLGRRIDVLHQST